MDFLIKHWAPYARRCEPSFRLVSSDIIPRKSSPVRHAFDTCNFSLILQGTGYYHREGTGYPVVAPCVITQWPGERVSYGPDPGTWTEWYFVYPAGDFTRFCRNGYIEPGRPVWPVADVAGVKRLLGEFRALAHSSDPAGVVDHIDRLAERALLATLLPPPRGNEPGQPIQQAADWVRANHGEHVDWPRLARRFGFSTITFRRRWVEAFGEPPAKTLQQWRMAEACRLLVESALRVKEIAGRVGFPDEYYFSRRFAAETGQPPSRYRSLYRLERGNP